MRRGSKRLTLSLMGVQSDVLHIVLQCESMEKTITIRLDAEQNEALTRRARTVGKSRSALVREILAKALSDETVSERAGHLKGTVPLQKPKSAWGKHLKEQNWR